jgi:hypothetical protein
MKERDQRKEVGRCERNSKANVPTRQKREEGESRMNNNTVFSVYIPEQFEIFRVPTPAEMIQTHKIPLNKSLVFRPPNESPSLNQTIQSIPLLIILSIHKREPFKVEF